MSEKYKESGVDLNASNKAIDLIKKQAKNSFSKNVVGNIGGFSAFYKFDKDKYVNPILVSSSDGVGTKVKIAINADKHDTIGIDLVAMLVNDLITSGADPMFMHDYLAVNKVVPEQIEMIIKGITDGCIEAQASLIGGEIAEMPDLYAEGEYDLAGFVVGVVDENKIINGKNIARGDILLGIPSTGLHSNGFSLVRKVLFKDNDFKLDQYIPDLSSDLGDILLTPTKIYAKLANQLKNFYDIKGFANITGGGILENVNRILPGGFRIKLDDWDIPPIFKFLQDVGKIENEEMFKVFNMGIGMVIIVSPEEADKIKNGKGYSFIDVGLVF